MASYGLYVVVMAVESEPERRKRLRQRTLFDDVAELYQATRPEYPDRVIEFIAATARLGAGSRVLEVGCGTGQLTRSLARREFGFGSGLTAIDIGASMIAAARSALADAHVSFEVTSFEDFSAAGESFDLVVSAAAFHWIDPAVRYEKSARLLRPGGWLAVLDNQDVYHDPFGTALRDMWAARGDWVSRRTDGRSFGGRFGEPVECVHDQLMARSAEAVIGLEHTRATSLSWPEDVRRDFTAELRRHLDGVAAVPLTLRTEVTMTPVLRSGLAQGEGNGLPGPTAGTLCHSSLTPCTQLDLQAPRWKPSYVDGAGGAFSPVRGSYVPTLVTQRGGP
jgi:ubiquinone/menaquinone biosynthesis C-methylase UbiE